MQRTIIVVVALIAVGVIAWIFWPTGEHEPAPREPVEEPAPPPMTPPEPTQTAPAQTPAEPETPPEPEVVLPPLQQSDEFVQERLQPMELPQNWVKQGDYVRRLAVLAENATRGEYPRSQLAFLAPHEPYKVERQDDRPFVDPKSYDRFDPYVEKLESIPPAQLAGLLDTIDPLVEKALNELGVEAPPGKVFEAAIDQVLEVPVLKGDGSVELVQPNVMYQYANPELESLSPLKKQVLRMGPENVQRLQTYLKRLAREMKLDVHS